MREQTQNMPFMYILYVLDEIMGYANLFVYQNVGGAFFAPPPHSFEMKSAIAYLFFVAKQKVA